MNFDIIIIMTASQITSCQFLAMSLEDNTEEF